MYMLRKSLRIRDALQRTIAATKSSSISDLIIGISILSICAQSNDIISILLTHSYIIKHRLRFELFVSNPLINISKIWYLGAYAVKVFDQMTVKDVVSWNSIIVVYEQNKNLMSVNVFFTIKQQVRLHAVN
ncbi:Pentatricopeptide repeat-containing protein [Melia azedarach]|uniref:Pentatricopeptide repeat-containing protein n=1 Tax=Melia azedarach TaxID=155640 RepID=A0ACC1X4L8_MELAZ|nr:Pentatricopeptide repeat-containing protein [Melia azedarach]